MLERPVAVGLHAVGVVVELLVEPGMHHRQVVSLEVVVDVHLPVAVDQPGLGRHVAHPLGCQRRGPLGDGVEEVRQRGRLEVEVGEDERPPGGHLHRHQPHGLGVEALAPLHLGRAQQRSIQPVRPAVIAALQRLPLAAPLGHRAGPVQADVVESAQRVAIADHDDRLVTDLRREEAPGFGHVGRPPHQLPRAAEDLLVLQREEDRVGVAARRDRLGAADVGVEREDQRHGRDSRVEMGDSRSEGRDRGATSTRPSRIANLVTVPPPAPPRSRRRRSPSSAPSRPGRNGTTSGTGARRRAAPPSARRWSA